MYIGTGNGTSCLPPVKWGTSDRGGEERGGERGDEKERGSEPGERD
jgi:hypothetical protein